MPETDGRLLSYVPGGKSPANSARVGRQYRRHRQGNRQQAKFDSVQDGVRGLGCAA